MTQTRLETGFDRDPEAFAARLREIADDLDAGAALDGYETYENVQAEEHTEIIVKFTYTPTA